MLCISSFLDVAMQWRYLTEIIIQIEKTYMHVWPVTMAVRPEASTPRVTSSAVEDEENPDDPFLLKNHMMSRACNDRTAAAAAASNLSWIVRTVVEQRKAMAMLQASIVTSFIWHRGKCQRPLSCRFYLIVAVRYICQAN